MYIDALATAVVQERNFPSMRCHATNENLVILSE
jgi:hypothetical protein